MALAPTAPAAVPDAAAEAQRLLNAGRNVILYGPPGTGKTHAALAVRDQWLADNGPGSVILTTFHPSYGYEDFVQGWRPDPAATGGFSLKDGVLLEAADQAETLAKAMQGGRVLLVMDEINRGDVARIFGEAITFIERDKRNLKFTTSQDRATERVLPDNLYFLGTMNTADKSISLLDVALRRRFAFIGCYPDPGAYARIADWATDVAGVDLGELLDELNARLAGHGVEKDRQIGHAMLGVSATVPDPRQALLDRLQYDVLPLVEEYLYSEPDSVASVLPTLAEARDRGDTLTTADFVAVTSDLVPDVGTTGTSSGDTSAAKVDDAESAAPMKDADQGPGSGDEPSPDPGQPQA